MVKGRKRRNNNSIFNKLQSLSRLRRNTWNKITDARFSSFASTLLAFTGLMIAIRTYYDQQESGPKQQSALDSSSSALGAMVKLAISQTHILARQQKSLDSNRAAVESTYEVALAQSVILLKSQQALDSSAKALAFVSRAARAQQNLLDKDVQIASRQLDIINEQWLSQQKQLNQKPVFNLLVSYKPEHKMLYDKLSDRKVPNEHLIDSLIFYGDIKPSLINKEEVIKIPIWLLDTKKYDVYGSIYFETSFKLLGVVKNVGDLNAVNLSINTEIYEDNNTSVHTNVNPMILRTDKFTKESFIIPIFVHVKALVRDRDNVIDSLQKRLDVLNGYPKAIGGIHTGKLNIYADNAPLQQFVFKFMIIE